MGPTFFLDPCLVLPPLESKIPRGLTLHVGYSLLFSQLGLVCFERTADEPIPACFGLGVTHMDYCIAPEVDQLVRMTKAGEGSGLLKKCQGECVADNDCEGNLECMERTSSTSPFPGCSGFGVVGVSYCFDPAEHEEDDNPLKGACETGCADYTDCEVGLNCYDASSGAIAPFGECVDVKLGVNFCYVPPTTELNLAGDNGHPKEAFPLALCSGDCDSKLIISHAYLALLSSVFSYISVLELFAQVIGIARGGWSVLNV